jgi:hypothetical protein
MTATFHPSQNFRRVPQSRTAGSSFGAGTSVARLDADEPNYAVRRLVAVVTVVSVLFVGAVAVGQAVGALADLGGRPAAASGLGAAGDGATSRTHVAQAGDTLWSIADDHRGEVGRAAYVDALISLNGGTSVQVGQAVRLP